MFDQQVAAFAVVAALLVDEAERQVRAKGHRMAWV